MIIYYMTIYNKPSFYAHILNGLLLLLAIVILYKNFTKMHLSAYHQLVIVLLFSISVGIHSISHLGLEQIYNFNPLKLKI